MGNPLERVLIDDDLDLSSDEEYIMMFLQAQSNAKLTRNQRFEELKRRSGSKSNPFIKKPPMLELKSLPSNLKYVFLDPPLFFFANCYCYRFVGDRRGGTFEGLTRQQ